MFGTLQNSLVFLISLATLVASTWALIEALRYPDRAYVAAGKRSKVLWGSIMGLATFISFVSLPPPLGRGGGPLGLLGIASIVAVLYFFVDVKPKLRDHHTPGSTRGPSNRGGW